MLYLECGWGVGEDGRGGALSPGFLIIIVLEARVPVRNR